MMHLRPSSSPCPLLFPPPQVVRASDRDKEVGEGESESSDEMVGGGGKVLMQWKGRCEGCGCGGEGGRGGKGRCVGCEVGG